MELILFLIMISVAFLIGEGCLSVIDRKHERDWRENVVTGAIVMIGLAEPVHIFGAFLGHPLHECTKYYLLIVAVVMAAGWLVRTLLLKKKEGVTKAPGEKKAVCEKKPVKEAVYWLYGVLAALIILQLGFANAANQSGRNFMDTDITPETVQSFLASDAVYQSNPLTGQAYTTGIPNRLRILDLSTFYAMIIQAAGCGMETLLYVVMPLVMFLVFYLTYYQLSKRLFADDTSRAIFMVFVAIVVLAGAYALPLDGAHLLYGAHTGKAIRNCVLVPYTIACALDGRWSKVLLCIVVEACIVWTLYGCGACLVAGAAIFVIRVFLNKKKEAPET